MSGPGRCCQKKQTRRPAITARAVGRHRKGAAPLPPCMAATLLTSPRIRSGFQRPPQTGSATRPPGPPPAAPPRGRPAAAAAPRSAARAAPPWPPHCQRPRQRAAAVDRGAAGRRQSVGGGSSAARRAAGGRASAAAVLLSLHRWARLLPLHREPAMLPFSWHYNELSMCCCDCKPAKTQQGRESPSEDPHGPPRGQDGELLDLACFTDCLR